MPRLLLGLVLLAGLIAGCGGSGSESLSSPCEEGQKSCIGTDLSVCRDGSWRFLKDCLPGVCLDGQCVEQASDGDLDDDQESSLTDGDLVDGDSDIAESEFDGFDIESDLENDWTDSVDNEDEVESVDEICESGLTHENGDQDRASTVLPPFTEADIHLCSWQERWYSFSLSDAENFRAHIDFQGDDALVELRLYEEEHNSLYDFVASGTSTSNESDLIYNGATAGVHYLRVFAMGSQHLFDLSLDTSSEPYGIEGDYCSNALSIALVEEIQADTTTAVDDFHSSCSPTMGFDMVYRLPTQVKMAR